MARIDAVREDVGPETDAPHALTPREMATVRAGWSAITGIGVAAIAIALLAFQPWIDFGAIDTNGTDVKTVTGESDGYFVIALAAVAFACAFGILARPRWTLALLPLAAASSILIFATACFTIFEDWQIAGFDGDGAFVYGGTPTVVPYLIAGLSVVIALLASVLAAVRASRTR